jgi:hypothetical protein
MIISNPALPVAILVQPAPVQHFLNPRRES